MSVLIKEMEMPMCCDDCPVFDDDGDYPTCILTRLSKGHNFPIFEKRMDNCPLVEISTVGPIRHGRWSHYYDDVLVSGTCSVCGWQSMIMETDVVDMPYCPNCGAKMDIEEEGV